MKAYFLGVQEKSYKGEKTMRLCFRNSETMENIFCNYYDWRPKEYVAAIADPEIAKRRKEKNIYELENIIKNLDMEILNYELAKATHGKNRDKVYIGVVLKNFFEKNKFIKKLKEKKIFDIYPDNIAHQRAYEEAFYEDFEMLWQGEYKLDLGDIINQTKNNFSIFKLKDFEFTGKINDNIGISSFDFETDVIKWDTVCIGCAEKYNGKINKKVYVWPFEDIEIEKYIKENDFKIIICDSKKDGFMKFGDDNYKNFLEWCDVSMSYNGKYYDRSETKREIKKIMTGKEFESSWKGKDGEKLTLHTVTDVGVEIRGLGIFDSDVYRSINKGRAFFLNPTQKNLSEIESLHGITRESQFRGMHTWKIRKNPELYQTVLERVVKDAESTLLIGENLLKNFIDMRITMPPHVWENLPNSVVANKMFNSWCLKC